MNYPEVIYTRGLIEKIYNSQPPTIRDILYKLMVGEINDEYIKTGKLKTLAGTIDLGHYTAKAMGFEPIEEMGVNSFRLASQKTSINYKAHLNNEAK